MCFDMIQEGGMKLAIIADDFTGANDTGVQFAKKGLQTIVTTVTEGIPEDLIEHEVLVVDTESRFDTKETAYGKVHRVTRELLNLGEPLLYKKIDSTFRGNIGGEVSGCLDASGKSYALMIPQLPSNGRTSRNGKVYVNGVLLGETEVAKDPKTPVKGSDMAKILGQQTDKKVKLLTKDTAGYNLFDIIKRIQEAKVEGSEIILLDADSNEDLKILATAVGLLPREFILVGTAGLAEFLPEGLSLKEKKGVLSIIGSVSDVTRNQLTYAQERTELDVVHYHLDQMLDEDKRRSVEKKVLKGLEEGRNIVIYTAENRDVISWSRKFAEEKGMNSFETSDFIAKSLGELTGILLKKGKNHLSGLYITGGDTLIKIAEELKIHGMVIHKEVLPAIPMGRFISKEFQDIDVVTKAGAFGKEEAFYEILKALKKS